MLARFPPRTDDARMLRPQLVVGLVAFVALAAIGACSRKAPSPPSGSHVEAPGHPSTWFTAAEIGARLGVPVGEGRATGPLAPRGDAAPGQSQRHHHGHGRGHSHPSRPHGRTVPGRLGACPPEHPAPDHVGRGVATGRGRVGMGHPDPGGRR